MTARALNDVDRHIAETRAHIKLERAIIERLRTGGHAGNLARSERLLKTFEDSLTVLLERRLTIVRELRRPRVSSQPRRDERLRRRRGS
jgi:hypothetical protein